jgi:hypothetical protein
MHPTTRLEENTRYVVIIHGMQGADGTEVPAPEGFARLRDGKAGSTPQLETLRAHYEENIFPVAEKAGVAREDLQLAWDFTVGPDEEVVGDLVQVAALTQDWLATQSPTVEIQTSLEPEGGENGIWRIIYGRVTGPRFAENDDPGATLLRDSDGKVKIEGTTTFEFTAQIPQSVRDLSGPGRALAYGHGFFGGQKEAEDPSSRNIAVSLDAVSFAIDWLGMSVEDVGILVGDLSEFPFQTLRFSERLPQAMANWMVMTRAIKEQLPQEAPFLRPDDAGPYYDPTFVPFLGISQGAILGGVQAALNPDLTRVCLNVGGAGFTGMMFRAQPFGRYLAFLSFALPDPLEQQKVIANMQRQFDAFDPGLYAHMVLRDQLPGAPANRQVLLQAGIADSSVPNVASFLHARLLGLGQTGPLHPRAFGIGGVDTPALASGFTLFDVGVSDAFYEVADIPKVNDAHGAVRGLPAMLEQLDAFFQPEGELIHPCDGLCDPD